MQDLCNICRLKAVTGGQGRQPRLSTLIKYPTQQTNVIPLSIGVDSGLTMQQQPFQLLNQRFPAACTLDHFEPKRWKKYCICSHSQIQLINSNREAIWLFKRYQFLTNDHFKRHSVIYEWPLNYEWPVPKLSPFTNPLTTICTSWWHNFSIPRIDPISTS